MSLAEAMEEIALMRLIKKMVQLFCMPHKLDVTFLDKKVDVSQAKTTINGVIDLFITSFKDASIHTHWDNNYEVISCSSAENGYRLQLTTDLYVTIVSFTIFQYLLKYKELGYPTHSVTPTSMSGEALSRLSNIVERLSAARQLGAGDS